MIALSTVEVFRDRQGDWLCESRRFRWRLELAHRGKPLSKVNAVVRATYRRLHKTAEVITIVKAAHPIREPFFDTIMQMGNLQSSAGDAINAKTTGFGPLPNTGCKGNMPRTFAPGCRRAPRQNPTSD